MATIYKTDADAVAMAYLRNNVNGAINPFHSAWLPAYVNTGMIGAFSTDPSQAHPSVDGHLANSTLADQSLRQAVIDLGLYYGWIARAHYGLIVTDANGNVSYAGEGIGYFVLNTAAPGAQDHFNSVANALTGLPFLQGRPPVYQELINQYTFAWNTIWNLKDNIQPDLAICHSSCHSSCHGSRGRR
jgi:hypothetical protein